MSEIGEELKELVRKEGFSIGVGTIICDNHHKFVKNCAGCECEEGCTRFLHLMMVMAKGCSYKPVNFEDSQNLDKWTQKQMAMALDKNITLEQLKEAV